MALFREGGAVLAYKNDISNFFWLYEMQVFRHCIQKICSSLISHEFLNIYLCRCNKGDMVQFLVKSNNVRHTASRHLANQNVWPTTKNVSKMSLIAENKEEARSIWGIIKIYVCTCSSNAIADTRPLLFHQKKKEWT